jgi:pimeloyl-ACP methyl ester carboxylesterase
MVFKRFFLLLTGCFKVSDKSKTLPSGAESASVESTESVASSETAITSLKIRLGDGRFLAYREKGVSKSKSNYRVIIVHGFGSSKEMDFVASQELMDKLGIYMVIYDRAGYGESDSNPKRSIKSEASDIEELADQLHLGQKFYVIGVSVGSYPTWSCLNCIPHRLAGVAFVVPCINYKWPSLPDDLTKDDYRKNMVRWMHWVARYTPGLLHWWLTQKIFPSSSVLDRNPNFFSDKDQEVLKNTPGYKLLSQNLLKEPEVFDTHRRDFLVAFGKWDFNPLDLKNPFPQNPSPVHIWQGYEDKVVPFQLQRYVSKKLPWIQYHEVPDGGHLLVYDSCVCEAVLKSLLLGENSSYYTPQISK